MFPAIDRRPALRRFIPHAVARAVIPEAGNASSARAGGAISSELGGCAAARPRRTGRAAKALLALCGAATILSACPLYSDSCDSRNDCASGFYCDQLSRECAPILDAISCVRPSQCEAGETCTPDFVCRPGSCDYHGCVRGYRCGVVDFAHTCVRVDDTSSEDASVSPADASAPPADAGTADAGAELDASAGPGDAAADAGP